MTSLAGKSVLLIVGGGIAAYKTHELVRLLKTRGARVRIIHDDHEMHLEIADDVHVGGAAGQGGDLCHAPGERRLAGDRPFAHGVDTQRVVRHLRRDVDGGWTPLLERFAQEANGETKQDAGPCLNEGASM